MALSFTSCSFVGEYPGGSGGQLWGGGGVELERTQGRSALMVTIRNGDEFPEIIFIKGIDQSHTID